VGRINDLQHLGGCSLPLQRLITLPGALVEFPLQLSNRPPKIGDFIIERRGHLRLPVRPAPDGSNLIGTRS
jgi:hypothetical protein